MKSFLKGIVGAVAALVVSAGLASACNVALVGVTPSCVVNQVVATRVAVVSPVFNQVAVVGVSPYFLGSRVVVVGGHRGVIARRGVVGHRAVGGRRVIRGRR